MARPIVTFPPLYDESVDSILGRILDPFGAVSDPRQRLNVAEGSFLYDIFSSFAVEMVRVYERLNQISTVGILVSAFGDYLDQKGVELGPLPRKDATPASLVMTVEATPGTLIPLYTRFTTTTSGIDEIPVEFVAQEAALVPAATPPDITATVLIPAQAAVAGLVGNVSEGSVTQLVDSIAGVVWVTNDTPGTGGLDVESDDDYRERILDAIAASAGAGTIADYRVWAAQIVGVGTAIVFPTWDGPGTVKVVAIGPDQSLPTVVAIRAAQLYLDPSVQLIAAGEVDDPWTGSPTTITYTTVSKGEGATSIEMTVAASGTYTATLERSPALSQSIDVDEFRMWIHVVSGLADIDHFRVQLTDNLSNTSYIDVPGLAAGEQWVTWMRSDMTTAGGFVWSNVVSVKFILLATGGGAVTVRADSLRYYDVDGSSGQGKAPIGAQVTVTGARSKPVDVAATITPRPGYTTAGLVDEVSAALDSLFARYDENTQRVYLTDVAVAIQSVQGVLTHTALTLNTVAADLVLTPEDIPVRNDVTLT